MNTVGLYSSAGGASSTAPGASRTDIVLPDARANGSLPPEGASVQVSLSPQAAAMLTIDMGSLAAKGYSRVDIDTDGRPGAEISVSVDASRGTVAVGTEQTLSQLRDMASPDKLDELVALLLQVLEDLREAGEDPNAQTLREALLAAYQDLAQA